MRYSCLCPSYKHPKVPQISDRPQNLEQKEQNNHMSKTPQVNRLGNRSKQLFSQILDYSSLMHGYFKLKFQVYAKLR